MKMKLFVCLLLVAALSLFAMSALADKSYPVDTAAELTQALANAATGGQGKVTITIAPGSVLEGTFWIEQNAGTNVVVQGDGSTTIIKGRMLIDGNSHHTNTETVMIKDLVFDASNLKGDDVIIREGVTLRAQGIIGQNDPAPEVRYPHNITIDGCTFVGNKDLNAVQFRQNYGFLRIIDCVADGVGSLLWQTANTPYEIVVDNADIRNCGGGITADRADNVTVKNSTFTNTEFGVRISLDAGSQITANITDNVFNIKQPVVLRYDNKGFDHQFTITGNNFTALTEDEKDQVITYTGSNDRGQASADMITGEENLDSKANNNQFYVAPPVVYIPRTGDNTHLALWAMLLGLSMAGMFMLRKRENN